ncbi:MAG: hypothetical protein ABUL72_03085, partial [Armatimonadota bacterium]
MTASHLVRPVTAMLLGIAVLVAGAQVPPILSRAHKVGRELSYSAIRVSMFKGKPVTERVFASHGMRRVERNGTTIIETGRERFIYDRQDNTLRRFTMGQMPMRPATQGPKALQQFSPPRGPNNKQRPPGWDGTYQVVDGGQIAGRR